MLLRYRLINVLMIVSTILGSRVHRSTTLAFPSDTDSDSSETYYPAVSSTEPETENPKVAESSVSAPLAVVSSSDEHKQLSVAGILKNAGFKVFCVGTTSRKDTTIGDEETFNTLVKFIHILLKEDIVLIGNTLNEVVKTIGVLSQGVIPSPEDWENKCGIGSEPVIIGEMGLDIAGSKLGFYSPSFQKRMSIRITKETWVKLFWAIDKIKKIIKEAEKEAGGASIVMEPFGRDGRSKRRFHAIARIIVSINLIEAIIPMMYEEYLRRCEDPSCTVDLIDNNSDKESCLSTCRDLLQTLAPDIIEREFAKCEIENHRGEADEYTLDYKLFFSGIMNDLYERAKVMVKNLESTTVRLNEAKYLEYLMYLEVRLKGLLDALKKIEREVNDMHKHS